MDNKKLVGAVIALSLILSVIGLFIPAIPKTGSNDVGGASGNLLAEEYIPYILYNNGFNTAKSIKTTGDLTVGSSGNALSLVKTGTCSLVSDSSIAATSTGTGTCATTGSLAGDVVVVSLATTTTKIAAQWVLVGTVATTDSTTVRLLNLTGTAAVPSATNGLGSSTQYQVFR